MQRAGRAGLLLCAAVLGAGCVAELGGMDAAATGDVRERAVADMAAAQRWARANQLAASGAVTCALLGDARALHCWGGHIVRFSAAGEPVHESSCVPELGEDWCSLRPLPMGVDEVVQIAMSSEGACGLRNDGEAICWHSTQHTFPDSETRHHIPHISRPTAKERLRGAVRFGYCHWGGWYAILASGVVKNDSHCDDLDDEFEQSVGYTHTCLRRADGTVWCWGSNALGQLGLGADHEALRHCLRHHRSRVPCAERPVQVPGLESVIDLAADHPRTCAVTEDGAVHCWGAWDEESLQSGRWSTPQRMHGFEQTSRVVVGMRHVCALDTAGAVRCLGDNTYGQVGDGSTQAREAPMAVPLPQPATELAAGSHHTCAVLADRSLWCWGDNDYGQLGDGTVEQRPSPVQTLPPGSVSPAPVTP